MSARGLMLGLGVGVGVWYVGLASGLFGDNAGSGADGGDIAAPQDQPGLFDVMTNLATNAVMNPTSLSPAGLALLEQFEGFSSTPYRDAGGYSIGYGHFIQAGEAFTAVTEAQGAELLRADVATAERVVSGAVSARLTQPQFDALVSLCYNIGGGAFRASSLVRVLNAGNYAGAADQFAAWNKSRQGGVLVVDDTLANRRAVEAQLFSNGVPA